MAGYLGASPVPQTIQKKETITAIAGQTTFNTTGYTDGNFINVFLNGVRLVNGTDYTATNGSDIVLGSAAAASDVLDFETFNEFQLTDQEFANSVIIENNTSEDSDGGRAGKLVYKGKQSGGEQSTLAEIQASHDGTADDQKGDLIFRTNDGSDGTSPTERLRIDSNGSIIPATLGTDNVHLGEGAGASIASGGIRNVLIGKDAGNAITTGDNNTFVGAFTGDVVTTGTSNTALGFASLSSCDVGNHNTAVGHGTLNALNYSSSTDGYNTAVGSGAGELMTTGTENTLIGALAGDAITTGSVNTAVGGGALGANTTASGNTAVGYGAMGANTTGNNNTALGSLSLDANTTGTSNTAVGRACLTTATTGTNNVGMGVSAMEALTTGDYNTGLGVSAGGGLTTSSDNTLIGYQAGLAVTTGLSHTMVGRSTGGTQATGHNGVYIGNSSRSSSTSVTAEFVIGYNQVGQGAGTITFGNSGAFTSISVGGTSWSGSSDSRLKKNITTSEAGLSFIKDLRPVTFEWKAKGEIPEVCGAYEKDSAEPYNDNDKVLHGFIAQEVKEVIDAHSEVKSGHALWTGGVDGIEQLAPTALVPMLVKAIQDLSAKNDALETENTAIKARLDALEAE